MIFSANQLTCESAYSGLAFPVLSHFQQLEFPVLVFAFVILFKSAEDKDGY